MQRQNDADTTANDTIVLHPERQRGLAAKIAAARTQRHGATIGRDEFLNDPNPEAPDVFEPPHQDFREELRRIIASDAERAANEAGAPAEPEAIPPKNSLFARLKTALYWLGCAFGISAIAYGLTRSP